MPVHLGLAQKSERRPTVSMRSLLRQHSTCAVSSVVMAFLFAPIVIPLLKHTKSTRLQDGTWHLASSVLESGKWPTLVPQQVDDDLSGFLYKVSTELPGFPTSSNVVKSVLQRIENISSMPSTGPVFNESEFISRLKEANSGDLHVSLHSVLDCLWGSHVSC